MREFRVQTAEGLKLIAAETQDEAIRLAKKDGHRVFYSCTQAMNDNSRIRCKAAIVRKVTELQGCKHINLILAMRDWLDEDIPDLLEELVKEGQLLEVQYVLPNMDYRFKSFYLPTGTSVTICDN